MKPVVRFGAHPDQLDQQVEGAAIKVRRLASEAPASSNAKDHLHSAPPGTRQFEATVGGLNANIRYYYAIFDGDEQLTPDGRDGESYFFKTHPQPVSAGSPSSDAPAGEPIRMWVVGDSGTGGSDQIAVFDAMKNHMNKLDDEIDLYLHVGDMAYGSGTDVQFAERFFAIYDSQLRNTVCWPTMGNHEGKTSKGESGIGPYYDSYICPTRAEAGGVASGKEAYYSFDYGPIHFVVLDSHDLDRRPGGAMAQWLKADLEQTSAEWLIAFWHHPAYTKGSHDSDTETQLREMHEHIMPLLESAGVDLTLAGHSHIYERSMLVDGAYATPTTAENVVLDDGDGSPKGDGAYRKSAGLNANEGTVNIVAGNGGAGVGRSGTMPIMRSILVEHGSVLLTLDGDTLTGVMVNKESRERDLFAIRKAGRVSPQRISKPWQHPPQAETTMSTRKGEPLPANARDILPRGALWHYFTGSVEGTKWLERDFAPSKWKQGKAGFGYGDKDDATTLDDMRHNYRIVRIRNSFEITEDEIETDGLGLAIRFDDAFIAYLNGKEILRVGVDSGAGEQARGVRAHEAGRKFRFFPIDHSLFRDGQNILAIEGHNTGLESSDFTLDPYLIQKK